MNEFYIRNVIEAALLAAGKPLQAAEIAQLFEENARPQVQEIQAALAALLSSYSDRGIEIKETAAGFRIQVRREFANEISRLWPERPARYSRALLETLALIAYRQPITRGEIEAVRGVAVNPNILKTVIERNWVRVVGHRDVPGRPELLGTTREFLDYFSLKSLDELPPLAELKSLGDIKVQFDLPDAGPVALIGVSDGPAGAADAATSGGAGEAVAGVTANDGVAAADVALAASDGVGDVIAAASVGDGIGDVASDETPGSEAEIVEGVVSDGAESAARDASVAVGGAPTDATALAERGELDTPGARVAGDDAVAGDGVSPGIVSDDALSPGVGTREDGANQSAKAAHADGSAPRPRRGAPATALHEAEEFAASIDADLAAGDDDAADDDELSASGPGSSELVAGPRDLDD